MVRNLHIKLDRSFVSPDKYAQPDVFGVNYENHMLIKLLFKLIIYSLASSCLVHVAPVAADSQNIASRTDHLYRHLNKLNRHSLSRDKPVTIILESNSIDLATSQLLKSLGSSVRYKAGKNHEIKLSPDKFLSLLNRLPKSIHARLPYPHEAVAVTSQGVEIMGAEDMQALGTEGNGVKIGIIDLGFSGYTFAQASGDLPANITAVDYTGNGIGGLNHGTQVAEIAYDMAPGAEFYLAKVGTTVQLQQAVSDMVTAGVKVINHSVAWFGAAFYDGTGPLCDITNGAEASGVHWVNAMGNSRNKHYLETFTDIDSNREHEFSTGQNYNTISLTSGSEVTLILNWDDYPVSRANYNLYLYNGVPGAGGVIVESSENSQSGAGGTPYESLTYTPTTTGTYYIVVKKTSTNTANIRFTLFSMGPDLGIKTRASSVTQPADCNSVFSVGATNLTDGAEYFSSEGPTTDNRNKPEISATNRVTTSLSSVFAGTSAAAPHVAGAAALLLSQNPSLTLTEVRNLLINDSKDVSSNGFDFRTGYGRISLDADMDSFNHDDDNCVLTSNIEQLDLDTDGQGDACDADIDGDGLSNIEESALGTDSLLTDTDNDSLTDYDEVMAYFTDPLLEDSDVDGLTDGAEVFTYSTNPLLSNIGDLAPKNSTDNVLNVSDLLILYRLVETIDSPTIYEQTAGDINSDGVLDLRDILQLSKNLGF